MVKIVSKGTIIKHDIGAGLVAVAQVISIDHSGAEVQTYDATTLDTTGAGIEYANTGYAEGGTIDLELFYDPLLAGHQGITDDITTPAEVPWEITYADAGVTTMAFTVAGTGWGFTVDMADGLKGSVSLKLDQLPTYPS